MWYNRIFFEDFWADVHRLHDDSWIDTYKPYLDSYLKIYKISGISFVERQLIGFEDEMTNHCVGSLPELFDGNPPFKGRGAVSFAMNVAEMLRILKLLSKYNF